MKLHQGVCRRELKIELDCHIGCWQLRNVSWYPRSYTISASEFVSIIIIISII